MAQPRRPLTSLILVLITAAGCSSAWLLAKGNFIPAIDLACAIASVTLLVWGLRRVYQEEAAGKQIKWRVIRMGRSLIHSLWAVVAILLNVVVVMIWYFTLPDLQKTRFGRRYYAYRQAGYENMVEVHIRNGLRQEYVASVFVGSGCGDSQCFSKAIDEAASRRINKNQ